MSSWEDFFNGIKEGYPICCIIRYCIDVARGYSPSLVRDKQYLLGTKFDDFSGPNYYEYVPCGIFHKGKKVIV